MLTANPAVRFSYLQSLVLEVSLVDSSGSAVRVRTLIFPTGFKAASLAARFTIWFPITSRLSPFSWPFHCVIVTFLGSQRASSKSSISGCFCFPSEVSSLSCYKDPYLRWRWRHNYCQCKCWPLFPLNISRLGSEQLAQPFVWSSHGPGIVPSLFLVDNHCFLILDFVLHRVALVGEQYFIWISPRHISEIWEQARKAFSDGHTVSYQACTAMWK